MSEFQIHTVPAGDLDSAWKRQMAVKLRGSWGEQYEIDFIRDLLRKAESFQIATIGEGNLEKLAGFACVTRYRGCPYDYEDKNLYIVGWFVEEELRRRGIGTKLKQACIDYAVFSSPNDDKYLFATTDDFTATRNLLYLGKLKGQPTDWEFVDMGKNEDGADTMRWRRPV